MLLSQFFDFGSNHLARTTPIKFQIIRNHGRIKEIQLQGLETIYIVVGGVVFHAWLLVYFATHQKIKHSTVKSNRCLVNLKPARYTMHLTYHMMMCCDKVHDSGYHFYFGVGKGRFNLSTLFLIHNEIVFVINAIG